MGFCMGFCNYLLWGFHGTRENSVLNAWGHLFSSIQAVNVAFGSFYGRTTNAKGFYNYIFCFLFPQVFILVT